ncbi:Uncharacterised protein [Neisseria meningitidis]|nr:Uncharacterised protein [Neisseria meningitidis]
MVLHRHIGSGRRRPQHQCGRPDCRRRKLRPPNLRRAHQPRTLPPLFPEKRLFGIGRRVGAEGGNKRRNHAPVCPHRPDRKNGAIHQRPRKGLHLNGADEAVCRNGQSLPCRLGDDRLPRVFGNDDAQIPTAAPRRPELHLEIPSNGDGKRYANRQNRANRAGKREKRLFCGTV